MNKINYNSKDYKIGYNNWKRFESEKNLDRQSKFTEWSKDLLDEYSILTDNLLKDIKSANKFKIWYTVNVCILWMYLWFFLTITFIVWK